MLPRLEKDRLCWHHKEWILSWNKILTFREDMCLKIGHHLLTKLIWAPQLNCVLFVSLDKIFLQTLLLFTSEHLQKTKIMMWQNQTKHLIYWGWILPFCPVLAKWNNLCHPYTEVQSTRPHVSRWFSPPTDREKKWGLK